MVRSIALLAVFAAALAPAWAAPKTVTYPLQVFPCRNMVTTDPHTGVQLTFLSTGPVREEDLYFHQRSFLSDDSIALFYSYADPRGELMGYIFATGEIVRIVTPRGAVFNATAALTGNRAYCTRGTEILDLALKLDVSKDRRPLPRASHARSE